MHCHRPDGTIAALGDSDSGRYADLLELAADLLDREDLRWAATAGAAGAAPARRYVSFATGGYHVQRSGWGDRGRAYADERWCIFDCGPLGDGGHGHYDLLSLEIAAGGRPLILDPGRYTYDEQEPNLRHWFKGTAAHNTVVVDGLDQTPYRRGQAAQGHDRPRPPRRPPQRAGPRHRRGRGDEHGLRRAPHPPRRVRRRRVLGRRGPPRRGGRAPLRPALPPRPGRRGPGRRCSAATVPPSSARRGSR